MTQIHFTKDDKTGRIHIHMTNEYGRVAIRAADIQRDATLFHVCEQAMTDADSGAIKVNGKRQDVSGS